MNKNIRNIDIITYKFKLALRRAANYKLKFAGK